MTRDTPFRALIAGGGPAALEAVLTLRELAPSLDVALLAPGAHHVYRPLSTVEPFARSKVRRYPLAKLADLDVAVHHDAVMRVDAEERLVITDAGREIPYDGLLMATGAQAMRAVPRALTFEGPSQVEAMHGLVQDIEGGYTRSVAFVAPPGTSWTLPLYELALQTAERADASCLDRVRLTLVSHERRPLELFGEEGSALAERLLDRAGIAFEPGTHAPVADRVVALPVPARGPVPGLPSDDRGFLPVDAFGRVPGVERVWAAGDGTSHPVKQGGLATQQADAAARSLAAFAGASVEVRPYRPVLRALLITGGEAWYLVRDLAAGGPARVSTRPLWSPPSKVAGQRLAPYLDGLDEAVHAYTFERRLGTAAEAR